MKAGGALGRVLARLGAALDGRAEMPERESQNRPESLMDSNMKGSKGVGLDGQHGPA